MLKTLVSGKEELATKDTKDTKNTKNTKKDNGIGLLTSDSQPNARQRIGQHRRGPTVSASNRRAGSSQGVAVF
jgi:hypothetical protein